MEKVKAKENEEREMEDSKWVCRLENGSKGGNWKWVCGLENG